MQLHGRNVTDLFKAAAVAAILAFPAQAAPFAIPFDFSRTALKVEVQIKGHPITVLLDTGVDPSVISFQKAKELGLRVDRSSAGEISGEGNAKSAQAVETTIEGLSIAGHRIPAIDALAADIGTISKTYGKPIDGVLGYSLLSGRIVLVDYPHRTIHFLDRPIEAGAVVAGCRSHWSTALYSYEGDNTPIIRDFRIGRGTAPISLDTGSNGGIALYQSALALPGVKTALHELGEVDYAGARGEAKTKKYRLDVPVGIGPFTLPRGQTVTVRVPQGSATTREANVGNQFYAALKLRMLLDYRNRIMTFYGDCR